MSLQISQFYRFSCYRGLGGPTTEKWTTGVTPSIVVTPAAGKVVYVTEAQFFMKDGFSIADAFRINPWGYDVTENVDIGSFNALYCACSVVHPMGPILSGDSYHWLRLEFRPFIQVSDASGTEFTLSNTGGAAGVLGADVEIAVFSYAVDQADA